MKKESNQSHPSHKLKAKRDLIDAFLVLRTADEVQRFIDDICTPKEITDLADRWLVAQLLDEGKLSYRAIYHKTGVSVTTIGRVARFLQHEKFQGYRLALDRRASQKTKVKGQR